MASDAMKITPRPRSRLRMPFSWVVGDLASQVLMLSSTLWMGSRPKACMSCLDIMLMLQAWPSARKFQGYFNGFKGSVSGKSAILVLETTYKNSLSMTWID